MGTTSRSDHPSFGEHISTQQKSTGVRIIFTLLLVLWILVGLPLGLQIWSESWMQGVGYAALFMAMNLFGLWWIFRAVDFYERGAVERLFWRRRVFPYDQVAKLEFNLVRTYVGVKSSITHAETKYRMRLEMTDGRKLRLEEQYGKRANGVRMTVLGREFDGAQEIDVVRDVIRLTMDLRNNPSGWRSAADGSGATAERPRFPQKRYFVVAKNTEKGPYTMDELRAAMEDNTLSRMTLVRAESDVEPQRLGELL